MTEVAILQTADRDREAGLSLGHQIRERLSGPPDAIIVFAAPGNDFRALLSALAESTDTTTIVGCSSAGEFTNDESGVGFTNATAIRASDMHFTASFGTGLTTDYARAAQDLAGRFQASQHPALPHRAALVLVDALAGHAEEFISALTVETAGSYRFFGGGAGDDARFQKTFVFCGTHVHENAAVALEIISKKPLGLGARHGWKPASSPLRVTEANASQVLSLNAAPAMEAFEEHAESTSQAIDPENPMPFFLHNIVGIDTDSGYKLRVPLGIADYGGIVCAAEIPTGSTTHIMATAGTSAVEAAAEATRDAVQQVTSAGNRPKAALFFDCVATRLRLGKSFEQELDAVATELDGVPFAGFNSYGQIVRADGQFSGFHNCTAVVCVLPD